jgi:RNA polymerase sigma-70 factor (ECF subfamily)
MADAGEPRGTTSFETFFRREYAVVARIAQGIVRDSHRAEDVAQEVFISAERRFSGHYDGVEASRWVRIAASHRGLNMIRGERRRSDREDRERIAPTPLQPDEQVLASERDELVRRALGRLPSHAATVLVLRHSGLSYTEVADVMGVKVGQVGTMLRRAEARLRREVEHESRH